VDIPLGMGLTLVFAPLPSPLRLGAEPLPCPGVDQEGWRDRSPKGEGS